MTHALVGVKPGAAPVQNEPGGSHSVCCRRRRCGDWRFPAGPSDFRSPITGRRSHGQARATDDLVNRILTLRTSLALASPHRRRLRLTPLRREVITDLSMLVRLVEPEGKDVLDIGCGRGALVRSLTNQGARVIGVEISQEQLAPAVA